MLFKTVVTFVSKLNSYYAKIKKLTSQHKMHYFTLFKSFSVSCFISVLERYGTNKNKYKYINSFKLLLTSRA